MRRIFISFHQTDADEVGRLKLTLLPFFDEIRTLGASELGADLDERINSEDAEYVMSQIRSRFISGTTCTIVAVGRCTWARRYVDWEIAATMRNNPTDPRGGIFAMQLPSAANSGWIQLPERLRRNIHWDSQGVQSGYGRFFTPQSAPSVPELVEAAIRRAATIDPVPGSLIGLRKRNAPCP